MDSIPDEVVESLRQIWNDIGIAEGEQTSKLADLRKQVADVYHTTQQQARREYETLKVQIAGLRASIELIAQDIHVASFDLSILHELKARDQVKLLQDEKDRLLTAQKQLLTSIQDTQARIIQLWCVTLGEDRDQLRLPECLKSHGREEALRKELQRLNQVLLDRQTRVRSELSQVREFVQIFGWGDADLTHEVDRVSLQEESCERAERSWCALVERRLRELEEDESDRRIDLANLVERAFALYSLLGHPNDESAKFIERYSDVSDRSLSAWRVEIERLETLEKRNVMSSIDALQKRLQAIWERMGLPAEERVGVLDALELESVLRKEEGGHKVAHRRLKDVVDKFETTVALVEPIEVLLARREDIRGKQESLKAESSDPLRLLSRTRSDPGKLLREEKLRKEIAGLDKLDAKILAKLKEFKDLAGSSFRWRGEVVEDRIRMDQRADAIEKQLLREKRQADRSNRLGLASPHAPSSATKSTPPRGSPGGAHSAPRSATRSATKLASTTGRSVHASTLSSAKKGASSGIFATPCAPETLRSNSHQPYGSHSVTTMRTPSCTTATTSTFSKFVASSTSWPPPSSKAGVVAEDRELYEPSFTKENFTPQQLGRPQADDSLLRWDQSPIAESERHAHYP